jgi:general secretion pathway protein A
MYERYFGLSDTPFRLTPDPRYLFLSRRHADALAHLKLGLTESSGFVCITGDVGTGKTTLLRHFLAGLTEDVSTAYVFNPALTSLELLQTINGEFGLPAASTSKTELIQALNTRLLAQHEAGRRSMVVIDEAQALDLEVLEQLRLLSNLETTTEKLLRIILVGQPQLRSLLLHPDLVQLNQRITLRWHVGPLERHETAAYVAHRLTVAGADTNRPIFTRRALARVHRHTGGVPRLINMIAHRTLLAAYAAGTPRAGVRAVAQAMHELSTVPLPVPARPIRSRRRVAAARVAGGGLGAAGLVGGRYQWTRPAPSAAVTAAVAAPAPVPVAAAPEPLDPVSVAPAAPPPDPAAVLRALDSGTSARHAVGTVLDAWEADPLAPDENVSSATFAQVAAAHGLEHVLLKANASMLRLLDVPAVLELHVPGGGPRFVALTGVDDADYHLRAGESVVVVSDDFLAEFWYGQAHVLWRDTQRLGPDALGTGMKGERVERLQRLLAAAGSYDGPLSGDFDPRTVLAVESFQRSHFLLPDGLVGPITRLALHGSAGPDARPSLVRPEPRP